MKNKIISFVVLFACVIAKVAQADIEVSDIQMFSGQPWQDVIIGYTISGETESFYDYSLNVVMTNCETGQAWTNKVMSANALAKGSHQFKWNYATISSSCCQVKIVVTRKQRGGVQLWENGPLWAECNVGAESPEDYGYYFWWGDTIGYKRNAANDGWIASDSSGSEYLFDICPTYVEDVATLKSMGYTYNNGLVAKYDAATVHLGAPWRMPTSAEINNLVSKCDTIWMERNGSYGMLIKGRGSYSSNSIFLPAAGHGAGSYLFDHDDTIRVGYYWSSSASSDYNFQSWMLRFNSYFLRDHSYRTKGMPIRPVR